MKNFIFSDNTLGTRLPKRKTLNFLKDFSSLQAKRDRQQKNYSRFLERNSLRFLKEEGKYYNQQEFDDLIETENKIFEELCRLYDDDDEDYLTKTKRDDEEDYVHQEFPQPPARFLVDFPEYCGDEEYHIPVSCVFKEDPLIIGEVCLRCNQPRIDNPEYQDSDSD